MSRRRILAATLAWLAVVATVSALVWVVISRAGDGLVSSDQPLMTTGEQTVSSPRGAAASPSRTPSRSPSRTPSRTPSPTPSESPSATPSATPSASASPSSTPTSTPSAPVSPSTSPPSPTQQPPVVANEQRRTWQGQAGSLVAACGASGIRFVSAQPADGFRADVHNEDGALEVEFEGGEDSAGAHVKVRARCEGGVPSFDVEVDD
jgi:cytoskeletal protein RodZ